MAELPQHVAVIPDGNRRWAKQKGLSTKEGHKAGYDVLKQTAFQAFDKGISTLTAYVFSTENWSRSSQEVTALMRLIAWVLQEEVKEFHKRGVRVRVLGSRDGLDAKLLASIEAAQTLTQNNTHGTVCICFNYGGRRDIIEAIQKIDDPKSVTEEKFGELLSTTGLPAPDLIIRTSGEQRLSNFLIWEGAYSELYFTDKLWPDFDAAEFDRALEAFANRKRNFGA